MKGVENIKVLTYLLLNILASLRIVSSSLSVSVSNPLAKLELLKVYIK